MASTRVWSEKIHPMDNSSLHFEVEVRGHTFTYGQRWFNCGEVIETFDCSCGFSATEAPGRGCWQYGHNEQRTASFDAVHGALLVLGAQAAREADVGYPAEWDGLERMGLEALEAADFGLSEALKFLNKQSGRPTAAQLRKLIENQLKDERPGGEAGSEQHCLVSGFWRWLNRHPYEQPEIIWAVGIEIAQEVLKAVKETLQSRKLPEWVVGKGFRAGETYSQPWGCDLTPTFDLLPTSGYLSGEPFVVFRQTLEEVGVALAVAAREEISSASQQVIKGLEATAAGREVVAAVLARDFDRLEFLGVFDG